MKKHAKRKVGTAGDGYIMTIQKMIPSLIDTIMMTQLAGTKMPVHYDHILNLMILPNIEL